MTRSPLVKSHLLWFLIFGMGGGLILMVCFIYPHLWKRIAEAKIIYNGQSSKQAKVYKSSDGDLLIDLGSDPGLYIVHFGSNKIGMTNPASFIFLPGFAYSKEKNAPFASMNPIKSAEPNLVIKERSVEFNSIQDGRALISW